MTLQDLALVVEGELARQEMNVVRQQLLDELTASEQRASVDTLTRVWSRGFMLRALDRARTHAIETATALPLALVDIDHFKRVNDTFGHVAGDEVLAAVAGWLRRSLRPADMVGRYGGEEFLVVLAPCDAEEARAVMERLRASVAECPVASSEGPVPVTVSVGLRHAADPARLTPTEQIRSADRALYVAKHEGRNRVCVDPDS